MVMTGAHDTFLVVLSILIAIFASEVAREVRARWPSLSIVFTSGLADTQAIQAVEGEGAIILRKPFRMGELLQALRRATMAA
jgi:hypothetical protein